MTALQAEQASFLLHGVLLPTMQNEFRVTKGVIAAIPLDKGDYRPDPVSKSALDLAWHIVSTEMRFIEAVVAGEFDLSPRPRPDNVTNSKEMVDWYDAKFGPHVELLAKMPGEQLATIVAFRGMLHLPGVMFLNLMIRHSVHHRGQLSVYLRPMGSKVPAIYGESYDTAEAKKAAQKA